MFFKIPGKILQTFRNAVVFLFFVMFFFLASAAKAQFVNDFGFKRSTKVPVYDSTNKLFDLAWTGGLNACQVHLFDLNSDQFQDLVIFDRHGNRLLTFLNDGSDSEYAFSFAPEYIGLFPDLEQWVQFIDFDNDGKKDLFTYITGGIRVFKNISDTAIRFTQITEPYLRTRLVNNQLINLFVTSVDYPAIVDIDSDGDPDVLTFWGLGTFLEKHSNQSKEFYGHCDSLEFRKTEYCWGYFAESDESNAITLDTCLELKNAGALPSAYRNKDDRHTGSTLLMLDMTGNGLKDLILGDIDFPGLTLLKNGGTADSAFITGIDTLFPSNTRPVQLFSFPVACFNDVNNDGVSDLLVSPFDPGMKRSMHHRCLWLYKNTGSNQNPVFVFEREDVFQHRMIDAGSGSMPVLYDLDGDGLSDLFIGNYGYNDTCYYDQFYILKCKYTSKLAYYKNTGSLNNPSFTLTESDFANLSALNLRAIYPTFGDIDNDGKAEMIIGNEDGSLLLFKNQADRGSPPVFVLNDDNYQQIKVSSFSAPQLIDLNSNGLPDLVLGQQNGKLSYYENQGNAVNPQFVKITDTLGGVNVTDPQLSYTGHSIPCFFRDAQQVLRLFVGSESGRIFYYKDVENNLGGNFTLVEERLASINEGIRTAPAIGYLTGTTYPDLITGNYGGGLSYYQGIMPEAHGIFNLRRNAFGEFDIYPNPASTFLILNISIGTENTKASLQVFDLTGRCVFELQNLNSGRNNFNVSGWYNGMYIFSVTFEDSYGKVWWSRKKQLINQ